MPLQPEADPLPAHVLDRLAKAGTASSSGRGDGAARASAAPDAGHAPRLPREYPTGFNSEAFQESLRINNRVLETRNLAELLAVTREELPSMEDGGLGSVNMSSVMYRSAYFWRRVEQAAQRPGAHRSNRARREYLAAYKDEHLRPVVDAILAPMVRKYVSGQYVRPYDLAITLWAFATCGMYDEDVFVALTSRINTMLHRLNPTDMTHIMWACGSVWHRQSPQVLEELAGQALASAGGFKTRELANFVWGMCRLNVRSEAMLQAAAHAVVDHPEDFEAEELVRLLWSFTKLQFGYAFSVGVHSVVAAQLVRPERVRKLVPQDISNTMWALAKRKCEVEPALLDALATAALAQLSYFKCQELSNLAYGVGRLLHRHEALMDAIVARATGPLRPRMKNQELCVILWALGKLRYVPIDPEAMDLFAAEFHERLPTLQPLTISNIVKAFAKLAYLPPEAMMNDISVAVCDGIEHFSMAELSNLLWAYRQLQWEDVGVFHAAEEYIADNVHECTDHHVTSVVNSLKGMGYLPETLVTAARIHGFHV